MADKLTRDENELNRFASLIGFQFTGAENGKCGCEMKVRDDLFHPGGIVHGGVAFSMADSSMAMALISTLEPGFTASTIECKISYFSPVVSGILKSEAEVVKRGRRIAFTEAVVTEGERIIAKATATFAIVEFRPPKQ